MSVCVNGKDCTLSKHWFISAWSNLLAGWRLLSAPSSNYTYLCDYLENEWSYLISDSGAGSTRIPRFGIRAQLRLTLWRWLIEILDLGRFWPHIWICRTPKIQGLTLPGALCQVPVNYPPIRGGSKQLGRTSAFYLETILDNKKIFQPKLVDLLTPRRKPQRKFA